MARDPNRKTDVPVRSIPQIVEWLLKSCTLEELLFMADLAGKKNHFRIFTSIITRLTEYNMHEVFYEKIGSSEELALFRAAKRGEVAGLKAFHMACQAAGEKIRQQKALKEEAKDV